MDEDNDFVIVAETPGNFVSRFGRRRFAKKRASDSVEAWWKKRMASSRQIADRLSQMVTRRNRELAFDAGFKALLGIAFSVITFGVLFWMGWVVGFFLAFHVNVYAWQFAAIVSGLFLVVAIWSAWRRVDPMAGLKPLTEAQMLLTLISPVTPGVMYFSPRHASAGLAVVLIGGPAGVFEAVGIWTHRLKAEASVIEQAARFLVACRAGLPVKQIEAPAAALLLRRLGLIRVVQTGDESTSIRLTDQGFNVLSAAVRKRAEK